MVRRKGQFFLIGAFFMIIVFYTGISAFISPSFMEPSMGETTGKIFENIKNEYPRAFNLGMDGSDAAGTLVGFTGFVRNVSRARNSQLAVLWVVTQNVSDDLNVTLGNFLGYAGEFVVNVSGDAKTIHVGDGETNSTLFASPPSTFELILNFNTQQNNVLLSKYKSNLYAVLEMTVGSDKVTGEIKA